MAHIPPPFLPQDMDRKLDEHFAFRGRRQRRGRPAATLAPDAHDIVSYPPAPPAGDRAPRVLPATLCRPRRAASRPAGSAAITSWSTNR